MVLISTQIEIASPPERVREVLLDFPRMPDWTQGFIKSIESRSNKPTIETGDKLTVVLEGATFSPIVLENSYHQLKWRGSLWPIFVGDHAFRYEPSKVTPGSTTFYQSEEFSGLLAFLMNLPFGMGKITAPGFERFNEDLKRKMESGV